MRLLISMARRSRASLLAITLLFFSAAKAQITSHDVFIPHGLTTLQVAFDSIESATGLHPHWPDGLLNPRKPVYGIGRPLTLYQVLRFYLEREGLRSEISGTTIYIMDGEQGKYGPDRSINDLRPVIIRVRDESGASLPYASLRCKSTGEAMCAGPDGWASIRAEAIPDSFDCSYAGMRDEAGVAKPGDTLFFTMKARGPLEDAIVTNYVDVPTALYTGNIVTVTRKQIGDQPLSNILASLAGRVTGLQETQTNGNTGSSYDLVIRGGMSMINGHDPLIIIDGVPFSPGARSVSNIFTGSAAGSHDPMSFLDKEDVESVRVLKDADATAIYGTRGANGVIIITTRKAVAGKLRITASLSRGVSAPTRLAEMMNSRDYTRMRWDALKNDGLKPDGRYAPELLKWDTTRYTDWQRYFFPSPGNITRGHVELTGGSAKDQYFIGGNMMRETNVFAGHPVHELFSLNGRIDHHSADNKLSIGLAVLAGWDGNTLPVSDVSRLAFLVPFAPAPVGRDGKLVFGENGLSYANPISFTGDKYHAGSHNYLGSMDMRYCIWDSLTIRLTAGGNKIYTRESTMDPTWTQDPAQNPVQRSALADGRYGSWIFEPRLEYKWLRRQWNIRVFAGMSRQGQRTTVDGWSATALPNDDSLASPGTTMTVTPLPHRVADYLYRAWFGQLTLHWKERYMLNLSGRRDGSSRFSRDNYYGNFGAVGAGWILSKEAFFRKILPVCSFAKIRGSYGTTGNDGVGSGESYQNNWSPTASQNFQRTTDMSSTAKFTTDAGWERVKKTEVSLECGVWKNRLLFTATWYLWRTDHQILPRKPTDSTGDVFLYETPVVLEARGWEFSVTSINIRSKKLIWTSTLGFSCPRNKLVSYPGIAQSPFKDLVVGASLSSMKAYRYIGVNPLTGVFAFQDQNGDGVINEADRTITANHDIRCLGGLENTLSWGNWEFNALLEFRCQTGISSGAAVYAVNRPGSIAYGFYSNQVADLNHHWQKPGDNAPYQMPTTKSSNEAGRAIGTYLSSTGVLMNADYLRLKSICISRRLPKLFKTAAGRIFIQGANLWTLTPYRNGDPEIQSILTIAPLKSFHIGVELRY